MEKVWINKESLVCERYPSNIEVDSSCVQVDVSDEDYEASFSGSELFAWKYIDGRLISVQIKEADPARKADEIRAIREVACFPIINRGILWYSTLTEEQEQDLKKWYADWLEAPEKLIIPDVPDWLH